MKFEANEIYTIKLASGEEYVVKITASDETTVTGEKPATLAPAERGMQLLPALLTGDHDKPVVFNLSQIALATLTRDTIADNYRSAISGLDIPSKSIIMG